MKSENNTMLVKKEQVHYTQLYGSLHYPQYTSPKSPDWDMRMQCTPILLHPSYCIKHSKIDQNTDNPFNKILSSSYFQIGKSHGNRSIENHLVFQKTNEATLSSTFCCLITKESTVKVKLY